MQHATERKTTKLEAYLQVIPSICAMLPDVGIGITNTKEWLVYYPGRKIDIGATPGRKIDPEEPLADCIKKKKLIKVEVPAEFFGVSFTGLAAPIVEGNEVIGAIAIQIQEQNEKELRRISDQIVGSITHANDRITVISDGADGLANISNTLLQQTTNAADAMKSTDEVIKFIKNIADQTNLLGLNASIEAARAGDKGRGFDIVAKEIRKLSHETVASTEKINNTLKNMQQSIEQMTALVEKVVSVGRNQATSTEELSAFMDQIEAMSKELSNHASKL